MHSPTDHNESTPEAQDDVVEQSVDQVDALEATEVPVALETTPAGEIAEVDSAHGNEESVVIEVPESQKVSFDTFDLQTPLRKAIDKLGFEFCTPIQAQSLVHTLLGHDVTGKAQPGTGKTAAFLITIINDLLSNPTNPII